MTETNKTTLERGKVLAIGNSFYAKIPQDWLEGQGFDLESVRNKDEEVRLYLIVNDTITIYPPHLHDEAIKALQ